MSKEILLVAEAVSNEKGVAKQVIYEAIEAAIAMATKKRYGNDWDVRVAIDTKTGEYATFRCWTVVEPDAETGEIEHPEHQLTLEQAQERKADAVIGDVFEESV